jgi:hypothetical protein
MQLMRDIMSDAVEQSTGARPSWPDPPVEAPEHEREIPKPN